MWLVCVAQLHRLCLPAVEMTLTAQGICASVNTPQQDWLHFYSSYPILPFFISYWDSLSFCHRFSSNLISIWACLVGHRPWHRAIPPAVSHLRVTEVRSSFLWSFMDNEAYNLQARRSRKCYFPRIMVISAWWSQSRASRAPLLSVQPNTQQGLASCWSDYWDEW